MTLDSVLIADDEPDIVRNVQNALLANGFGVLVANNGLDAWRALTSQPEQIAACIIDLQMPPGALGGRDLVVRIRQAFSTTLPIVIYSGRGSISLAHEVTKAGANEFVEKEAGVNRLVDVVARLVATTNRPTEGTGTSLNALAVSGDVQWLASKSFKNLERSVRAILLNVRQTPKQLHDHFAGGRHRPPPHVMKRLQEIDTFEHEARLSLGDLMDLLAALAAAQVHRLPRAAKISSLKDQLVPVRNSLEHGRSVPARTLLIGYMASEEMIELLRGTE
jgi:DNA-binding response OmpR family regulator